MTVQEKRSQIGARRHPEVGPRSDQDLDRDLNECHVEYVVYGDEATGHSKGTIFVVGDGLDGKLAGEMEGEEAVKTVTAHYCADTSLDAGMSLSMATFKGGLYE